MKICEECGVMLEQHHSIGLWVTAGGGQGSAYCHGGEGGVVGESQSHTPTSVVLPDTSSREAVEAWLDA